MTCRNSAGAVIKLPRHVYSPNSEVYVSNDGKIPGGMISVQVPTLLCMQNKLIIHSRYCFVEQYVYPRGPNIYMGNLYLRYE